MTDKPAMSAGFQMNAEHIWGQSPDGEPPLTRTERMNHPREQGASL